MFSSGGGCEITVTTRVKTAWKKFRELLPVLTSCHLSYLTSETWPLTKSNLQHNDRAMIRQICSTYQARGCGHSEVKRFELDDRDLILRERRLRWFEHVERSSCAVKIQIDGRRGAGRSKLTWKKLMEKDCCEWKLTSIDPQESSTYRSGVRSAIRAASQLPERGPTVLHDAPAPAHYSKI